MTKPVTKVAIITGGSKSSVQTYASYFPRQKAVLIVKCYIANGIGLAVARALSQRLDWQINILGTNEERGRQAVAEHSNMTFYRVDVAQYGDLANAFDTVYNKHGRLDFVFANAGISGGLDFYTRHPAGEIPPEPSVKTAEINFNGVIYTSHLALHYFRQSPGGGKGASLLLTGSSGSFYPSGITPIYAATKHGVLGFMRSIAPFFVLDGIRVNALCPGTVRTGIMDDEAWKLFPDELIIPMEVVLDATLQMVDGEDMVDCTGIKIPASELYGRAVEVSGDNFYFREQQEWCDDKQKQVMTITMTGAL